jgi:hypothetical protein
MTEFSGGRISNHYEIRAIYAEFVEQEKFALEVCRRCRDSVQLARGEKRLSHLSDGPPYMALVNPKPCTKSILKLSPFFIEMEN